MRKNNYITSFVLLTISLILKHLFYDFLLSLILPLIVISILLIINLICPRIYNFYKKNKEDKNYIIRLIINYLAIYIIIYLEESFFISLIYMVILVCFIILNKIYLKTSKIFKSILISILPIISIILIIILTNKVSVILEWNKIKDDYKLINNKILEYKEELCKKDCDDFIIYLDNSNDIIEFTKKELESIERIKNYYPTQEVIIIYNDKIVYGMVNGVVDIEIAYSPKNKLSENYCDIYKLEDNWYRLVYNDKIIKT